MHKALKEQLLSQIDNVLAYQGVMRDKGQHEDLSGLPSWEYERFNTMALAAIQRSTGTDSIYMQQAVEASKAKEARPDYYRSFKRVLSILGVFVMLSRPTISKVLQH